MWFAVSPNRYIWDHGNLHMQLELPIWISEKFETKWCEKLGTVMWIRMLVSEWGNHAEKPVFCLLWLCNYPPNLSALKTERFFTWLWDLTGPSRAVPPLTFSHSCRQRVLIHSHVWHPGWEDWNIWESSDGFLCLPLVSPHGLSSLVALEYLDVLHDSLELSRCISQERASHAQVASYLWASLWCHTASLLTAHLVQVVVTIPLQKKFKRREHTPLLLKRRLS